MSHRKAREEDVMLRRMFFRLLPVQSMIIAMGSINTIVDGVIAARFIGPASVGVIGLYYTMIRILEASGSVLLGGVTVLSGRYLGSGRIDKTRGITSLGLVLALIISLVLTAASLFAPGQIADLLGANAQLKDSLSAYVRGYAIGIVPQLLGQQFANTLQLERKENLGNLAVAVMVACNVILDILFVVFWNMGIWGLALSTSLSNWAYFLVVAHYYLKKEAQLKPSMALIDWSRTLSLVTIGFPNALLVICLAARSLILNRLLLTYSGNDGLSALSSFNLVIGLILALTLGTGALVRMLSSVFLGEENRESLCSLIRLCLTRVMVLTIGIAAAVIILAPVLAGIFYPDSTSEVHRLTKQLFTIYAFGIPAALGCVVISSFFQAARHLVFVNLISVVDGFLSAVIPALILAPVMGATGVWIAFLIGLFITLACSILYPVLRLRRLPRSLDEWMLLPPSFGSGEHLVLRLHNLDDVIMTAERVQAFCDRHNLPRLTGSHTGLCLEEMAGNIVSHGFHKDKKRHNIEVRVVLLEDSVVLRIKDDCIPFNPQEYHEMTTSSGDPLSNVGIRLVYKIADEIEYQNLLGLNVLTITLNT